MNLFLTLQQACGEVLMFLSPVKQLNQPTLRNLLSPVTEAPSSPLPFSYWAILAVVVLIIISVSVYFLWRHRSFHTNFLQTLSHSVEQVSELEYCQIKNLPDVVEVLGKQDYQLLQNSGQKMQENALRIYQGKWIGEPSDQLQLDKVLTKVQYRSTTGELAIQVLSFAVLATAMFLLFGLSLAQDRSSIIQLAFLPLLTGALFSFLLFFQSLRAKQDIQRGLNLLSERITEKVPVFRELAGTAALIESFFQYDRQMSASIQQLTQSVEDLTNHQLSKHLADNVKEVMESHVVPPMVQATNSIENLTEELSIRQEDGMRNLAQEFTTNLAISMEEKLQPFYEEISILTRDLYTANKQLEVSLHTMENYKKQSLDIQDGMRYSIEALAQARHDWQEDMEVQANSLERLAETSNTLATLQEGSEKNLKGSMDILGQRMESLQDILYRVTQGLHLENQQSSESIRELKDSTAKTLADMRQLSSVLVEQSDYMLRQTQLLQESVGSVEEALQSSIHTFSTQLLHGVNETLDSFDDGLAEVTDRLSNTTAEINDTVGTWAADVRWAEEYRYRQKLEGDLERDKKQQDLLNILYAEEDPVGDRKDDEDLE